MVNWNDPAIVARDYAGLVNSVHAVGGLYIWEFFVTLDFDWDIIRGRRKYPYTFPLYLGCRLSGISAIVALFVGFDASSKIDCQVWVVFVFLLAYLSFVFASALIVLRIVAIWEKNRLITAIAVVTWLTNTAFYIHSVIVTQAAWNEDAGFCLVLHTARSRDNVLVTLATDTVLLLLTLFGLLRWRNAGMAGGIWRLLYTQGLLWIVVVTLGEVPAAVFILLNLNDPFNLMFQVPEMIIVAIGATRIYRGLVDYTSILELQGTSNAPFELPTRARAGGNFYYTDPTLFVLEPIVKDSSWLSERQVFTGKGGTPSCGHQDR